MDRLCIDSYSRIQQYLAIATIILLFNNLLQNQQGKEWKSSWKTYEYCYISMHACLQLY